MTTYRYIIDEKDGKVRVYYPDGTELSSSPMSADTDSYQEPQILFSCLFSEFVGVVNAEYASSSDITINKTAISLLSAIVFPQEHTEVKQQ